MVLEQFELQQLLNEPHKAGIDYEKSILELLEELKNNPDNIQIHYFLGIMYTRSLQYNKALEHLTYVSESQFGFMYLTHVRIISGFIYSKQGLYDMALDAIESALEQDNNNVAALCIQGYCYYSQKKYEIATEVYKRVLFHDENNATAMNSLGYINIITGENMDIGIELCKKALELQPKNPAYLDSVGWGYYKNGEESIAVEYLREAFELAPDNKEIKTHLRQIMNL